MDLALDSGLARTYTSKAQVARIVTESWAGANLYCPACSSDSIEPTPPGTKVVDFKCPSCEEPFQLKSQSRPFRSRVTDAAYEPMIRSVETGTAPTFVFLEYDRVRWKVQELFFVPRHFLSASVIEKRPPLRSTARRARWLGCNICLSVLPEDAKVDAVRGGAQLPREAVRKAWRSFSFLLESPPESRGWTADVLVCVRLLHRETFHLADLYAFEERLGRLHPQNRNLRAKIRQQLQILRDHGVVEFSGRGSYRLLLVPSFSSRG